VSRISASFSRLNAGTSRIFDFGETLVTPPRTWLHGAKARLTSQKQQGLRLGIISNTPGMTSRQGILSRLPIDFDFSLFEAELALFSSEVGIEKPNRENLELAVDNTGLSPEQCVYCSENAIETLAAQAEGMPSLRIVTGSSDLTNLPDFLTYLN
jgi:FMN phosphatase YigB (HAD superfamily)